MKTRHVRIGCSGWYYRHWKGVAYPEDLPASQWFSLYQHTFNTVELNAPFYHWPKPVTVQKWARQAMPAFRYSVKVNRRITHLKRFNSTRKLVRNFCRFADVLDEHMGCFLFQLPPSFRYTPARLHAIVRQLDSRHRNVVEFRHDSWWNDEVFKVFRDADLIFCSVNAPQLPDDVIKTGDVIYVRFHGAKEWYRYNYSDAELKAWAKKIHARDAREIWAYFNNDFRGCAFQNAQTLKRLLR